LTFVSSLRTDERHARRFEHPNQLSSEALEPALREPTERLQAESSPIEEEPLLDMAMV
jgi:hypothetical protein